MLIRKIRYPAIISLLMAPVLTVQANGFRVPEISIVGTATSNSLVANTEELGAIAYNPAAMSFHDGKNLAVGVNYITYDANVSPSGGTPTGGNGDDDFFVPNFYLSARGQSNWSFGLGINAPFGLETNWPDETFPGFAGAQDALEPALSRINMININPSFAYKIDDTTSFAFGLQYYDVRQVNLNTQAVILDGEGHGYGFNLGIQKKIDDITLGLSYKSAVKTDIKGYLSGSTGILGVFAKLEFPEIIQGGIHYQATSKLGIEFDLEHVGWDSFDTINVVDSAGTVRSSSANKWKDTLAYRLGLTYALSSNTKLMFGYSADETAQPDSNFSARVPDSDRQLFSIGITQKLGSWSLEAAYMYVDVDDRTVNSASGFTTDANGSSAYNGTYSSEVQIIGLGLTTTF